MRHAIHRRQHGAVIVTVALLLLFLLGFIGIALDFGKLFVVKSETADRNGQLRACCGTGTRPAAFHRGSAFGHRPRQERGAHRRKPQRRELPVNQLERQRPVGRCGSHLQGYRVRHHDRSHSRPVRGVPACPAFGAALAAGSPGHLSSGNTTDFPNTHNVVAGAPSRRAPTARALADPGDPQAAGGRSGAALRLAPGEWITVLTSQSAIPGGYIGWANLDGSTARRKQGWR